MADRSRTVNTDFDCRCGETIAFQHWEVIDEAARPDLVGQLAAGQLERVQCPHCRRILRPRLPVAVIRNAGRNDIAMLFTAEPEPPERSPDWWVELREASPPVRVMPLIYDAAAIVLPRDLRADLADPTAASELVRTSSGADAAERYGHFLHDVEFGEALDRTMGILELITPIETSEAFAQLVEDHPWLLSEESEAALRTGGEALPGQRENVAGVVRLFRDACADPTAAWQLHEQDADRAADRLEAAFGPHLNRLEELGEARRWDELIAEGRSAITLAMARGASVFMGIVHDFVGRALLETRSGDHAKNVDEAIEHLENAVAAAGESDIRGIRLGHLGIAWSARPLGDPRVNLERGVEALREAERLLRDTDERDMLAMVRTNLAYSLRQRESGDRLENLLEARRLCELALQWRSPARNAVDWGYTQVNLGTILESLADLGHARHRQARRAYEAVVGQREAIDDPRVTGSAYTNLASQDRARAERALTPWRKRRALRSAEAHVRRAASAVEGGDAHGHGRALGRLALIRADLDDAEGALVAARAAADILKPSLSASEAAEANARLAGLLDMSHDWAGAALHYERAIEAAEIAYLERSNAADRAAELANRSNLNRWASYALARAGNHKKAILLLEDGRTREFRRRLGPEQDALERLSHRSPGLYGEYVDARADLGFADLADDTDAAVRRYEEILSRVRRVPTLEGFGASVAWETIANAAQPGCPIIFVNPAPEGTALLAVSRERPGDDAAVDVAFLDVTSTAIITRLLIGDEHERRGGVSYLGEISTPRGRLQSALDAMLPWIGERVARPIEHFLARTGASGATLVTCGPLALVPIHAGRWREGEATVSLVDRRVIRFAPSATLHAACVRRAAERTEAHTLVAVADPRPDSQDLPAARAEVERIAGRFPGDRMVAYGAEATSSFLIANAATASHLHLACHARGNVFSFRESSLQLADEDLALTRLAALGDLSARLVVVSACETGVTDVSDTNEEAYSLAAMFIAAGSACAVASLWQVDDYATALLMTHFYDLLFGDPPVNPADAFRAAQLWLRQLSASDHAAYVAERPALGEELARRRSSDRASDVVPSGDEQTHDGPRPFEHPRYWASFLVVGT